MAYLSTDRVALMLAVADYLDTMVDYPAARKKDVGYVAEKAADYLAKAASIMELVGAPENGGRGTIGGWGVETDSGSGNDSPVCTTDVVHTHPQAINFPTPAAPEPDPFRDADDASQNGATPDGVACEQDGAKKRTTGKSRRTRTPEQLDEEEARVRTMVPPSCAVLTEAFLDVVSAEGTKSGRITQARIITVITALAEINSMYGEKALEYGLNAAIRKSVPNTNYVKKAAEGYSTPAPLPYQVPSIVPEGPSLPALDYDQEALMIQYRRSDGSYDLNGATQWCLSHGMDKAQTDTYLVPILEHILAQEGPADASATA